MATFSNNIRINAAISISDDKAIGAGTTLYTAPANGYAIIQFRSTASVAAGEYEIGGQPMSIWALGNNEITMHIGPSQTIRHAIAGVAGTAYFTGVEFINSV